MNPSFEELFTDQFMQENTAFENLQQFFDAVDVKDEKDFEDLDQKKLEQLVQTSTNFSNWGQMQEAAATEYLGNNFL